MAKTIPEITYDATEAFWESVKRDLMLMGERDFFEQLKADSFDEFAEILSRALMERATEIRQ